MDCFPDFCLGCDNQVTTGFYCSEACRMSDIERSGSVPSSPIHSHSGSPYQFIFPTNFHQPPSKYPPPPTKSSSSSSLSKTTHHHYSKSANYHSPQRVLSPSSSRSSLISNVSTPEASEQTAKELSSYFNAFDRTRDQRRKSLPAGKHLTSTTIRSFADGH
ncbi:hypothetical protein BDZ85DRAFT_277195 [Elsinoe ampelina]|uniref:Uncharacterized protein n=1 Tax=Elsinoe ampelina TaxID=302913 RepID=A0A6A6GNK8_9PEZI|nr:hypothetical protein BDZ85DRAFT_277195 [Elsinoe ampelina]